MAARASQLSQTIADAKAQIDGLNAQINSLRGAMALDGELLRQKKALDEGRRAEIARLQASMAEHSAKLDELRKYWWVPGYGSYLAIDSLVQDDIGALHTVQTSLNTSQQDAQRLESELQNLCSQLNASAARLLSSSAAEADAQQRVGRANRELALVQSRAAYAESLRANAAELQLLVEHLADNDIEDLKEALQRVLSTELQTQARVVTQSTHAFENSLLTFALALDDKADFLSFDPPAGVAIIVRNRGAYVARCRVVSASDPAQAGDWTPTMAFLQEVQLQLSRPPFQACDVVFVEVDVKLGPNTRSTAILTVQDDFGAPPLAARLINTLVDARFELEV